MGIHNNIIHDLYCAYGSIWSNDELSFSTRKVLAETQTGLVGSRGLEIEGFEVENLEAFCRKLEGMGITLDRPYRRIDELDIAVAFFTDPWGTYIELTEGLDNY